MKNVACDYTIKLILCVSILPIRAITRQPRSTSALFVKRVKAFLCISGYASSSRIATGRATAPSATAGHRRPPRLRAADEQGRDRRALPARDGGACPWAIAPNWGHTPAFSRAKAGAGSGPDPMPRAAPTAFQPREGQPAPPTAGVRCRPSWRQGAVRNGRTAVPAPTLARAVRERRPETQAIRVSAAAGCVAPRTARTGQATLSFPHLAWPV